MLTTTIDLDAIAHNTRRLREQTTAELMCVVKADAYNHGVERCVPVMEANGLDHGLKPAMTWSAPVVTVKPMRKGEATSYARTWEAPADGFTAVIPAGYADGVQRSWQGAVEVDIAGRSYQQVGRVSMDQIVVWLGDNEADVTAGDEAVIFGDATALAKRAGTINYEVVCAPRGRTTRTYIGEGK